MAEDESAVQVSHPELGGRSMIAEPARGSDQAADAPGADAPHPDIELLVPADDEMDPEVSIVIPAVNEELCISDFVAWCHEGLRKAGVNGEILIVDSSTDRTPELALAGGARVLRTPKRGLGRAYIDAIPFIRGQYVIMGDADCTYDFRNLDGFVTKLRDGYELAMGSRWLGSIERGSMPPLHQYIGTPFTTWILNRIYGSRFTDIHCGMRGFAYALKGWVCNPVLGVRLRNGAQVRPHGTQNG